MVVGSGWLESKISDCLWLDLSLGQDEQLLEDNVDDVTGQLENKGGGSQGPGC